MRSEEEIKGWRDNIMKKASCEDGLTFSDRLTIYKTLNWVLGEIDFWVVNEGGGDENKS